MADLSQYLAQIEERLNAKTIHELRQIARAVGVVRPADGQKGRILNDALEIASGRRDPCEPTKRGAPPKSNEYDRVLVTDILKCRELYLSEGADEREEGFKFSVGSGKDENLEATTVYGILDKSGKDWFVRVNESYGDVYMNESFASVYGLRMGDYLCCEAKRVQSDQMAGVVNVLEVNGVSPPDMIKRKEFSALTPVAAIRRIHLTFDTADRMIDLFAPICAGARVGVFGAACPQKSKLLKDMAKSLSDSGCHVVILKIDSSYEDVADLQDGDCYAFASYYDSSKDTHIRTAKLALEYAKRQAELGMDAVLIIDSVNSLAAAFNSYGKHVSLQLEVSTLEEVKKYFAAAHDNKEGGSITLIASIDDDDDLGDSLNALLKKACNTRITLSETARQSRIYPDLDLKATYSVNENKALSEEESAASLKLRGMSVGDIIAEFSETGANAELIEKFKG